VVTKCFGIVLPTDPPAVVVVPSLVRWEDSRPHDLLDVRYFYHLRQCRRGATKNTEPSTRYQLRLGPLCRLYLPAGVSLLRSFGWLTGPEDVVETLHIYTYTIHTSWRTSKERKKMNLKHHDSGWHFAICYRGFDSPTRQVQMDCLSNVYSSTYLDTLVLVHLVLGDCEVYLPPATGQIETRGTRSWS
jgi:hypothetical protein